MTDLSPMNLAGVQPLPDAGWLPPEAPLAMPLQVLERPRLSLAAVLAAMTGGPRLPGGAVR